VYFVYIAIAMISPTSQITIIPHSQQPLVTRNYPSESELDATIARASQAQQTWSRVPLKERIAIGVKFMVHLDACNHNAIVLTINPQNEFKKMSDEIALELTMQMGR
jgi:acyl-CoA reductase-like NAD-dependent aldehyde dehydrogenase